MNEKFTNWIKWDNRNQISNINYPGIYVIALSNMNIEGEIFEWREEVIYIGMTNSLKGLRGRLKQFDNTINGKRGHGGAQRVIYKYSNVQELLDRLYVAVRYFECDVSSNKSNDLLVMGEVAKFEYVCFAEFVKKFNKLPDFNNKKLSPKK